MAQPTAATLKARQREFANRIGLEYCGCDKLIPLGGHSTFQVPRILFDMWYDSRICDLAWWAVGEQLDRHADSRVIDHAWMIGFDGAPNEPWALVTEPYIDEKVAAEAARLANQAMERWGVTVHVLPTEASTWNPGRCTPIVATFEPGGVGHFMHQAVAWALNVMHPMIDHEAELTTSTAGGSRQENR